MEGIGYALLVLAGTVALALDVDRALANLLVIFFASGIFFQALYIEESKENTQKLTNSKS